MLWVLQGREKTPKTKHRPPGWLPRSGSAERWVPGVLGMRAKVLRPIVTHGPNTTLSSFCWAFRTTKDPHCLKEINGNHNYEPQALRWCSTGNESGIETTQRKVQSLHRTSLESRQSQAHPFQPTSEARRITAYICGGLRGERMPSALQQGGLARRPPDPFQFGRARVVAVHPSQVA